MANIIDITLPIYEGMPVYKNKPEKQPTIKETQSGHVHESRICIDVHTGTHIDAPLHMIQNGETIETIELNKLVGPCRVIDLTHVKEQITRADLTPFDINENEIILFKTQNSFDKKFNFNFIFLEVSGADYLAERGIHLVGIDSLGIERSQEGHPTHKKLFESNIIIIEGLKLDHVKPGPYTLYAAPLKLQGIDAAPARVFLIEE